MADLSELQAAGTTKIVGSTTTGSETTPAAVSSNGDINVVDGLATGGVNGNLLLVTAGTQYEAKVGASKLTGRKMLLITALDDMFWGVTATVTTATGTPLYKNQQVQFSIEPDGGFQVWLVAASNNRNARIIESL